MKVEVSQASPRCGGSVQRSVPAPSSRQNSPPAHSSVSLHGVPALPKGAQTPGDHPARSGTNGRFFSAQSSSTTCRPEASAVGTPPPGSTHCPAM